MKSVRTKAKQGTILLSTVLVLALTILACGGGGPQQVEVVKEITRVVPQTVEVTRIVEQTVEVTRVAQVVVTATPKPSTPTPEPTATPEEPTGENIFALNYLAEQESGGIKVEIVRVLVGEKEAEEKQMDVDFDQAEIFQDKPVVAEIIFRVTNTTDKVVSIYPDQATVVIGNEQIDLTDYMWAGTTFGDDFSGDIYPGVMAVGGIWFGVKRHAVQNIKKMLIAFSGPQDEDLNRLGDDFEFQLDLSNHEWHPIPDEWK